jgi:hypothetical protein
MKTYLPKISLFLLFICSVAFTHAQQATASPVKTVSEQLHEQQVKKATDITNRIAGTITINDEQKAKIQASMLEALVKYNDALAKARKEDESRLASLNQELIADINARLKTILTAEQFNTMMNKEKAQ